MEAEAAQIFTRLLDKLVPLAPWAGGLLVVAVCLRVVGERPSSLLEALAALLWGWRRPK